MEKTKTITQKTEPTTQKTEPTTQKTEPTTQKTETTTQKIILLIKNNPEITRNELAEQCNLSPDAIKWQLKQLKEKGLIRRIGPDKGGHWEIVDLGC